MWIKKKQPKSSLCLLIQITIMSSCSPSFHNISICPNGAQKSTEDYTLAYSSFPHSFNDSITIGFLGAYGQAQVVLGALPLAVAAVNNAKGLIFRSS